MKEIITKRKLRKVGTKENPSYVVPLKKRELLLANIDVEKEINIEVKQ